MFSAAEAARFLDEAHRARARYQNLSEAIAPTNFDEAYAAFAWCRAIGYNPEAPTR